MSKTLLAFLAFFAVSVFGQEYFKEYREAAARLERTSEEDYALGEKLLAEMREMAKGRVRHFPQPMLVMETLSAAGRMWYTNHFYTDRQLFSARDMWNTGRDPYKLAGHKKTFDLLQSCGVDVLLAFQYNNTALYYYINADRAQLEKSNLRLTPLYTPQWNGERLKREDQVKRFAQSKHTCMVDGKMFLPMYYEHTFTPKQIQQFIADMEAQGGKKVAYIHYWGTLFDGGDPFWDYVKPGNGKRISAIRLLKWFDTITSYLEVCDGIEYFAHMERADGRFLTEYYSEVLFPIFYSALAQEPFRGKKIFGLQIMTGYNNYRSYQRMSHDCTKTLRNYLELCRQWQPDYMRGFEWDEYQEDTHFQPTVNKPMAYMRILKYYMDTFKGIAPTPFKGDDLSLPNLIVSHRKQQPAGNDFEFEVLNIPDTTQPEAYSVTVELLDRDGKVLAKEKLEFDCAVLGEHTLRVSAADYAEAGIIAPRLTLEYKGNTRIIQEGLPFAVARPSTICDSNYYSTPLRNLLFPKKSSVAFGKVGRAGRLSEYIEVPVDVDLEFDEELNSVEVIQERSTLFAYDPQNEFHQNDDDWMNLLLVMYGHWQPDRVGVDLTFDLENAPSALVYDYAVDAKKPEQSPMENPTVPQIASPLAKANHFVDKIGHWRRWKSIALKKSEWGKAVFKIKGTRTSGALNGVPFEWEMPLSKLEASGFQATVLEDGLQFSLERPVNMEIMPLPLNSRTARFHTVVRTGYPHSVFMVQAVSRSGKVWRSAPFAAWPRPKATKKGNVKDVKVAVFDDGKGPYSISVKSYMLPRIDYRFDPECAGNILTCPAGREYYAFAGGYDTVPTGFQGFHESGRSMPGTFYRMRKANGTEDLSAPKWVKMLDGNWCLEFSGRGEFITFPPSVLPQRTGFKFRCEICPNNVKQDQLYFTQGSYSPKGFQLRTENGVFVIDFYRRQANLVEYENYDFFKTDLRPIEGQWQVVEFKYDLNTVSLTVNGKTQSFKTSGFPQWVQLGGFGGTSLGGLREDKAVPSFNGRLKALSISHGW